MVYMTSIGVNDGHVISRKYHEEYHGTDQAPPLRNDNEGIQDVGSHPYGQPPVTLDDIYAACVENWLTKSDSEHEKLFIMDENDIVKHCSYRPRNCADDCSIFASLDKIDW
jgi:hypothetical protein